MAWGLFENISVKFKTPKNESILNDCVAIIERGNFVVCLNQFLYRDLL